jgi:hypothetical protein
VIFFAGSARYLLPMAAPVALLASRLRPRWLTLGVAANLVLGLGLAVVNYQHWDQYRWFAHVHRNLGEGGHHVWVDGLWGLRHYFGEEGALPLKKGQVVPAGDVVVTSELSKSIDLNAPVAPIAEMVIQPAIPLRIIGLETASGYSSVGRGLWPFGVSTGVIDRVRAVRIAERNPTLEYLPMDAPEAKEQIVSGVWSLEGRQRWMAKSASVVLKSPAAPTPLRVVFTIHPKAPARRVRLLLDGREVAAQSYPGPGTYTLVSPPLQPASGVAVVAIECDATFTAPPDTRDLGLVLTSVGFAR